MQFVQRARRHQIGDAGVFFRLPEIGQNHRVKFQALGQRRRQADHPAPPDPEPTAEEDLMSMTVDHEYRITMLELGITE